MLIIELECAVRLITSRYYFRQQALNRTQCALPIPMLVYNIYDFSELVD